MTVGELKNWLNDFSDDAKIIIKGFNDDYVDSIGKIRECGVRSFWGKDYKAVAICGNDQIGAICSLQDLSEEDD